MAGGSRIIPRAPALAGAFLVRGSWGGALLFGGWSDPAPAVFLSPHLSHKPPPFVLHQISELPKTLRPTRLSGGTGKSADGPPGDSYGPARLGCP